MQSSIDEVPEYEPQPTSPRLLDKYLAKNRPAPAIFKPITNRGSTPPHVNLAYRHPSLLLEESDDEETMIVPSLRQTPDAKENCRLIGKVNPNIVKTWEQIKSALHVGEPESASTCSDDKQSFSLFVQKPYDFDQKGDKFPVRKLVRTSDSEFSEDFFDSIDESSLPNGPRKICWSLGDTTK